MYVTIHVAHTVAQGTQGHAKDTARTPHRVPVQTARGLPQIPADDERLQRMVYAMDYTLHHSTYACTKRDEGNYTNAYIYILGCRRARRWYSTHARTHARENYFKQLVFVDLSLIMHEVYLHISLKF